MVDINLKREDAFATAESMGTKASSSRVQLGDPRNGEDFSGPGSPISALAAGEKPLGVKSRYGERRFQGEENSIWAGHPCHGLPEFGRGF